MGFINFMNYNYMDNFIYFVKCVNLIMEMDSFNLRNHWTSYLQTHDGRHNCSYLD